MMEPEEFSLLGGPLHRVAARLHLVYGRTNTFALGLVLGVIPWIIMVVLAFFARGAYAVFSLSFISAHIRLLVVIPLLLPFMGPELNLTRAIATQDPGVTPMHLPVVVEYYWIFCLILFRFLLLRWLWRLGLWSHFLWRLSRLDLHLVPTHPDGVAGSGYIEVVLIHFAPLVVAISGSSIRVVC